VIVTLAGLQTRLARPGEPAQPIRLIHYTLNTGQTVESPRSAVGEAGIEALRPLVEGGGHVPGCSPFRVKMDRGEGSAVFTVWREQEPIATCGLAWSVEGAAQVWPAIEQVYLDLADRHPQLMAPGQASQKPEVLPWLAVVLLPGMLAQTFDDIGWLEDFERCMAWAILTDTAPNRANG
jgi:hypothetical protein